MRTLLSYITVAASCLLLGGLVGYGYGNFDRSELIDQRNQSLLLVVDYKNMMDKQLVINTDCVDTLTKLQTLSTECCDMAEKTMNEFDNYMKERSKLRNIYAY